MGHHFLYARKTGRGGTYVVEMPILSAASELKKKWPDGVQVGVLGGADLKSIKRVYGEFAPFYRASTVAEAVSKAQASVSF